MKAIGIFTLISLLLLTGCGSPTNVQPIDYGNPPTNYQATIQQYFRNILLEPESAEFRFGNPVAASTTKGLIYGGGLAWAGYIVDTGVKAKNQFGGYSVTIYQVRFKGDQIYDVKPVQ